VSDEPLADHELDGLFSGIASASAVVVAVSGGPDSMALLSALARWRDLGATPRLLAATVDHGLRPQGAGDADLAAALAGRLGVEHRRLAWTGDKPDGGLQEAARAARYALLIDLARELGATHLLTAHTLDDQAETVLIRLSRGSGLAGLAGMRPMIDRDGVVHVRPFLDLSKGRLIATCRAWGVEFAQDPSNQDPRFARARWRALLPELAREGLTPRRLARLAARAARAEDALAAKAEKALDAAGIEGGVAARVFCDEPFEIALRVLVTACGRAVPEGAPPVRLERFEAALRGLRQAVAAQARFRRTLRGTLIAFDGSALVSFGVEPERRRGRQGGVDQVDAARPRSLGKGPGRA